MSLRFLVPALGALAFTGTSFAAELQGGISLGGFVDAIGTASNTSDDGESTAYEFTSAVELRFGAKIDDKVGVKVDVEFNNNNAATGVHDDAYLEQAYINWAFDKQTSLTFGKFSTWQGWVATDSDGLYRVNRGPIAALYGEDAIGAALNYMPNQQFGVSFFLVNGIGYDEADAFGNEQTDGSYFVSPAVDVTYKVDGVGSFNGEISYDFEGSDARDVLHVGLNTTLKFKSVEALTLGAELIYQAIGETEAGGDDFTHLGLLGMANYKFVGAPKPMSGTLMVQYIQATDSVPGTGTGGAPANSGFADGVDATVLEVAAALLTNPTGSAAFGLNFELAYQTVDVDTAEDTIDSVSAAIELLALIP